MDKHHLQEIEDDAAREGVDRFKTQLELILLTLVDEDPAVALGQIEAGREVALENASTASSPFLTAPEETKSARVASSLINNTFARLRLVMEAHDDEEEEVTAASPRHRKRDPA